MKGVVDDFQLAVIRHIICFNWILNIRLCNFWKGGKSPQALQRPELKRSQSYCTLGKFGRGLYLGDSEAIIRGTLKRLWKEAEYLWFVVRWCCSSGCHYWAPGLQGKPACTRNGEAFQILQWDYECFAGPLERSKSPAANPRTTNCK